MSTTPHQALDSLLERKINLTAAEREQGSISHNRIRDLLTNKAMNDSTFPWLLDGDFLSGSFARKTKIRPLDDIDVIMVLDGEGLIPLDGGQRLPNMYVKGSGTAGSPVNNLMNWNNLISSNQILQKFATALQEAYPNSTIKPDGQAVNVQFDSYGLGLDIVPAFNILPVGGGEGIYYIPQGDGSDMWMKTNPKLDIKICKDLHDRHDQKLKPVLRLIRHWSNETHGDTMRAFHVEVMAWNVFHNRQQSIGSYSEALHHFFQYAPAHFAGDCPDPTGIGQPLDRYLTQEIRNSAVQKAQIAQNISSAAWTYEVSGSHDKAIAEWEKLFGNLR